MRVYLDIDDVLRDYVWGLIQRYGWPHRWSGGLAEMWGGEVNWKNHFQVTSHSVFLMGLRPILRSQMGAWAIHRHPDFDLEYVTATRKGGFEELVTGRWLRANGFPPAKLTCTDMDGGKPEYLLSKVEYRDIVIDDDLRNLTPVYENTPALCMVFDAPWNRHASVHRRVRNWYELSEIFEKDNYVEMFNDEYL